MEGFRSISHCEGSGRASAFSFTGPPNRRLITKGDPPALPGRQQKFDSSCNHAPGSTDEILNVSPPAIGVDVLNRTSTFDAHFESILLRDPQKSFFDSIDPLRSSLTCLSLRAPIRSHGSKLH